MKKHFSLFLPVCDFTYMYLDLIGSDLFMGINRKNYASWAEKLQEIPHKYRKNCEYSGGF